MKKILFFSLTLLIISFLGSCKKDESTTPDVEETTVKGRIVQVYTTIPVPNATVYLYETVRSSSGGLLGGGAHTVSLDTTVTNDKGEYSFTYKRRRGGNEYFIRSFAKNFDEKPGNFYVTEKNSNMDVPIFPYAWIKIRLINLPPVNASDYILVGGWIGDSYTKSGKCDTIFTQRVFTGNAKNSLYKYQNNDKGDLVFSRLDSIYCKGLDTTYHTIAY